MLSKCIVSEKIERMIMLKKYTAPEIKYTEFESENIITASGDTNGFKYGNDATAQAGVVYAARVEQWNNLMEFSN